MSEMSTAGATATRRVLVTGVAGSPGTGLATALGDDPSLERVVAVDTVAPSEPLGRVEFVRTDIQASALPGLLEAAEIDTVMHLGLSRPHDSVGSPAVRADVVGVAGVLAACAEAASLRRLVVRSSGVIYGASSHAPAWFTEDMEPTSLPARGHAREVWEAERCVRGFMRRRGDVAVTVLRFADLVGPEVDSALTWYFRLPAVPTMLGYDPRLQLLHEQDAVTALLRVCSETHPGTFNVGGDGVIMLSQAIRRARRVPLPVPGPLARGGSELLRCAGVPAFTPERLSLAGQGRGMDTSRLTAELGWRPAHSTLSAFDDFVGRDE